MVTGFLPSAFKYKQQLVKFCGGKGRIEDEHMYIKVKTHTCFTFIKDKVEMQVKESY